MFRIGYEQLEDQGHGKQETPRVIIWKVDWGSCEEASWLNMQCSSEHP